MYNITGKDAQWCPITRVFADKCPNGGGHRWAGGNPRHTHSTIPQSPSAAASHHPQPATPIPFISRIATLALTLPLPPNLPPPVLHHPSLEEATATSTSSSPSPPAHSIAPSSPPLDPPPHTLLILLPANEAAASPEDVRFSLVPSPKSIFVAFNLC